MHHFRWGLQKWVVDVLFKFPKALKNVGGIIQIAESIDPNGPNKTSCGASQHSGMITRGKKTQEVQAIIPIQRTNGRYNFQQGWHPLLKTRQIMLLLWTECQTVALSSSFHKVHDATLWNQALPKFIPKVIYNDCVEISVFFLQKIAQYLQVIENDTSILIRTCGCLLQS